MTTNGATLLAPSIPKCFLNSSDTSVSFTLHYVPWNGRANLGPPIRINHLLQLASRTIFLESNGMLPRFVHQGPCLRKASSSRHTGWNDVDFQAREELHFMERQRGHALERLKVGQRLQSIALTMKKRDIFLVSRQQSIAGVPRNE